MSLNKRNKKRIIGLLMVGVITTLVGCSEKGQELTEKEKTEVMNSIMEFSREEKEDLNELDKLISENIELFNQTEKDEIINTYLMNMYSFSDDLGNKLYTIGYELDDVVKNYEVDVINPSTYAKIPNEHATVKGFLTEVNEEGFALKRDDENSPFYIDINLQKVLDKYGDYMSKSLREYVEFNVYEMNEPEFIDIEKEEINIDEVVNRILKIEKGMETDKAQNYEFIDKWTSSLEYYYDVLFGLSHEYFVSSEFIKEDILKKYEEIVKENQGTKLAKDTEKVIEILKGNDKKVDNKTMGEIIDYVQGTIYTDEVKDVIKQKYPELITNTTETTITTGTTTADTVE